jgi:hypothetical protein
MPLPPDLRAIIDDDLARLRAAAAELAPTAEPVLAGSMAFDEPWARRVEGGWRLESDYDLYLLEPSPTRALRLSRSETLAGLGERVGTRAPVDVFVLWRPLLERGWAGMVGRSLEHGAFIDCRLEPRGLLVNQARKAMIRARLLAPRERPERSGYQIVKAAVEALRATVIARNPSINPTALFSLRANRRWLEAWPGALPSPHRATLESLLEARLELGAPELHAPLLQRCHAWLEHFAAGMPELLAEAPEAGPGPRGTSVRAWGGLLRQGLLPDPLLDYDRELTLLLADPDLPLLAGRGELRGGFEQRWRHLAPAGWRPRRPGALLRAVDRALGNPTSAKGERFLLPREPA